MKISGKFDVTVKPMDPYAKGIEGSNLGRMSINKIFHGDLSAESKGEMLSVVTPVKGSAGYVAIEQVVGALGGKRGTFVLQHFGTMKEGKDRLVLEVVPDSGTGELTGLSGEMSIKVEDGQHLFDFDYAFNR
ncbi:DUF3224 domain-containing protein [Microbulbifer sp. JMSA004]|uniref:DUF3224 domain-containing protein n=1 Tax=unclassified Microbulbifer TaxID=2619833 RepID=UPI0024AE6CEB|nr:DUF3224 domain-containing protein [Microbulbifer sp. VAAF005]WHI46982.1 DUF3224 domain-containing protein [Microbulbifer sp. VAAF005]